MQLILSKIVLMYTYIITHTQSEISKSLSSEFEEFIPDTITPWGGGEDGGWEQLLLAAVTAVRADGVAFAAASAASTGAEEAEVTILDNICCIQTHTYTHTCTRARTCTHMCDTCACAHAQEAAAAAVQRAVAAGVELKEAQSMAAGNVAELLANAAAAQAHVDAAELLHVNATSMAATTKHEAQAAAAESEELAAAVHDSERRRARSWTTRRVMLPPGGRTAMRLLICPALETQQTIVSLSWNPAYSVILRMTALTPWGNRATALSPQVRMWMFLGRGGLCQFLGCLAFESAELWSAVFINADKQTCLCSCY